MAEWARCCHILATGQPGTYLGTVLDAPSVSRMCWDWGVLPSQASHPQCPMSSIEQKMDEMEFHPIQSSSAECK